MKKLLLALCAITALTLTVRADDAPAAPKKPELTAEQKAVMKDMLAKYDTNKDGKLSKDERAAMSAEDKAKTRASWGTLEVVASVFILICILGAYLYFRG